MNVPVTLSNSLRNELKIPLGDILPEDLAGRESIQSAISGKYVITVGDRTTEKLIDFGLVPSLQIIDNIEKRERRVALGNDGVSSFLKCTNPAAEITSESINTIKKAFSMKPPVRIVIDGEEDLLVIPACIYAPDNSVILYGQPNQGLVIAPITTTIRNKTQRLLYMINGG